MGQQQQLPKSLAGGARQDTVTGGMWGVILLFLVVGNGKPAPTPQTTTPPPHQATAWLYPVVVCTRAGGPPTCGLEISCLEG